MASTTGPQDLLPTTPPAPKGWEWPGLRELVATVIFFMVVLGAVLGMVLQLFNPKKRAAEVGQVVSHAARAAKQAASGVLDETAGAEPSNSAPQV